MKRLSMLQLAGTALAGVGLVLGLQGQAQAAASGSSSAAPAPAVTVKAAAAGNYYVVTIYENGVEAGSAWWSQDPTNGDPGDALAAEDVLADGYGINAHLSTGRMATTAGHSSPYFSPWVTGDLPEDQPYGMWACLEKGGVQYACTSTYTVYS